MNDCFTLEGNLTTGRTTLSLILVLLLVINRTTQLFRFLNQGLTGTGYFANI